jgi:hypothetical protein
MMNTKVMAYMVAAIAVGFFLISAVPDRLSMLVAPTEILRSDGTPEESGENILSTESGELGQLEEQGFTSLIDLYKWWAIDLIIAFSVYLVARRVFV